MHDAQGRRLFERGRTIDGKVLDNARRKDRLAQVAQAARPGTSDTELEELMSWRKHRHDDSPPGDR